MRVAPNTYMGRKIVHTDGTVTSPIANVGTVVQAITVPGGAVICQLKGVSAGIRVGLSDDLSDGYETYLTSEWSNPIPVADVTNIYTRIDVGAGTTNVEFRFELA